MDLTLYEDALDFVFDTPDIRNDTMKALKIFKPCELVILTNGNIKMFDKLSFNTGLSEYIDKILSADSVKLFKPRSNLYELALRHPGVSKLNKPSEKLGFEPDYVASDLLELSIFITEG